ncbi:raffinose/stachyose/melibiose transport system substrate-binding protein [Thermocatellispora tengchongensis]|uniref:Raffinose/stachyose/melibiose transport system substrate-binding protein n=1 Tax=Thermocatellispora tengchongensis TaxID=1073253 RepID=A0A840P2M3_9ACTN|nr:extracellular solute-binding protein [Thermocatellispora tengchongensis]MBB5131487.1 raffinose/stachyose/melibiose transport system substrate-binding protein [Thermocatellispora tengchongensis]
MGNLLKRMTAVALAAVPLVLAGCAVGGGGAAQSKTTLSFVMWGDGEDSAKAYKDVIADFEKANPGIKVNLETFSTTNYDTVLKSRLAGGAGPDIYGFDQKNLTDFIKAGYTTNLVGEPWFASLTEDAKREATRFAAAGEAHYVPISQSGNGIVYNKALFDKAGVTEEPQTLDELIAVSEKLKKAKITPLAMSAQESWWPQFIIYYAIAQHVYDKNPNFNEDVMSGKDSIGSNAGWKESLEIYRKLVPYFMDNPLGTNQTAAQSAFIRGNAAMFPAPWILQEARDAKLDVGYFNFPTTDTAETKTMWGSYLVSLGINPKNGKKDLASKFIGFLFSPQAYTKFLGTVRAFPTAQGVDVGTIDPLFPDMQQAWEGRTFATLLLPPVPGIQDVLLKELQNLTGGRTEVADVLKKLQDTVDEEREAGN